MFKNIFVVAVLVFSSVFSLASEKVIRVSIHHGYLDNRGKSNYVGGKLTQEWLSYYFSLDCQNNHLDAVCDYQIQKLTDNYFEVSKVFQTRTGSVKVIVSDYSPNVTDNDELNRTVYRDQQLQLSARSKQQFHEAISTADIVVYIGHSRYGGGPDFAMPVLTKSNAHNEFFYKNKFTGFQELKTAFEESSKRPSNFVLLSCSSGPHFGGSLKKEFPDVNFYLTSDVVTQTAEQGAERAMRILQNILKAKLNAL